MSQELATLETLRKAARKHVVEFEQDLNGQTDQHSLSDRAKSVASLRTLVKIIEEIAELEERFKRSGEIASEQEFNGKQRRGLAKRIEALRRRN